MTKTDIDHIDPSWAEGRDYMLVCGLDVVYNMCERDKILNIKKSNRFLPWRNCRDEIGGDPIEQGDLCLFLDPDTNEWVLEEFMGTWWFEKSTRYGSKANQTQSAEARQKISEAASNISEETRRKMSKASTGRRHSEETRRRLGDVNTGSKRPEWAKHKMAEAQRRRYARDRCRRMSLSDPQMPDFED